MNPYLLLPITLLAGLIFSCGKKIYSSKSNGSAASVWLLSSVSALVSCFGLLIIFGFNSASTFTIFIGLLYGISYATQLICDIKALRTGPMSFINLFVSFSMVLPAISGALFFGEKMGFAHYIGIILVLVSFILFVKKDTEQKKYDKRWLIYTAICFVCNGAVSILQKIHGNSVHSAQINEFLIIAFFAIFVIMTAFAIFSKKNDLGNLFERKENGKINWSLIILMLIIGVCTAVMHRMNTYLASVIDSAVFFPIVNGGNALLVIVASMVVFKEKLDVRQFIGVIVGLVAILLLCNPFA